MRGQDGADACRRPCTCLNGGTVNDKIKQGGLIAKLIASKKSPEERITELYIRCFSRKPDKDELAKLVPLVAASQGPDPGARRHLLGVAQQP